MKIYYTRWWNRSDSHIPNSLYLEDRNWDDYGYKTTFYLYYYSEKCEEIFIGEVKIYNIQNNITANQILSEGMDSFDENFVSLGQSEEYYKNIKQLHEKGEFDKDIVLTKLKDWSKYSVEKKNLFRRYIAFRYSLLREWQASYILENIDNLLSNEDEMDLNIEFTYLKKLPNAEKEHKIDFDFRKSLSLPHRIFVLIGKNGVGKTEILGHLANDLGKNKESSFERNFPKYSKIIYFYYGKDVEMNSMLKEEDFIGEIKLEKINIKEQDETISYKKLIELVKSKKRFELALTAIQTVIGRDNIDDNLFPKYELSSGQKVIYKLILNFLSKIERNSLIIIDELEVHLHPNMLSQMITIIRNFLEIFNSYSIMSTHSSYILQQVPSKNIRVIERDGNIPKVKKLENECFGENLSEISEKVFQVNDNEAEYKKIFNEMKKQGLSREEIETLFENKLSFNARIYLISIYS